MGTRVKAGPERNETGSYGFSNSFPQFKKPLPKDQENKLLAMHKAGKLNASIYVAIVLAVYLVLLTILLCRYARRKHRSGEESSYFHPHSHHSHHPPIPTVVVGKTGCCAGGPVATIVRLCFPGRTAGTEAQHPFEESQNYPMETIDLKPNGSNSACPSVSITRARSDENGINAPVSV